VRLEAAPSPRGATQVSLQIDIEASPLGEFTLSSGPLPAITDRVVAQQASSYWLEPLSPGIRHLIRFEEEASTEKLGSDS
jgi:hypothetical protein